jgi:hypothetical protein
LLSPADGTLPGRDQTFNAMKAVAKKEITELNFMSEVSCIMGVTIRRA